MRLPPQDFLGFLFLDYDRKSGALEPTKLAKNLFY